MLGLKLIQVSNKAVCCGIPPHPLEIGCHLAYFLVQAREYSIDLLIPKWLIIDIDNKAIVLEEETFIHVKIIPVMIVTFISDGIWQKNWPVIQRSVCNMYLLVNQ